MSDQRSWWQQTSWLQRGALGVVAVLFVAGAITIVSQMQRNADLRTGVGELESQEEELTNDLESAQSDLSQSQSTIAALEAEVAELEGQVAQLEEEIESIESQATSDVSEAEEELTDALAEQEEAEQLVAELTSAYSEEIQSARTSLTESLSDFACGWGLDHAAAGNPSDTISSQTVRDAWRSTEEFGSLSSDPAIEAALNVSEVTGEPIVNLTADEVEGVAVGCWQEEDAQINAELYAHEAVLRQSALEAACTVGRDEVFGDFAQGFEDTSTYEDWQLSLGADEASEYVDSVEERFGTVAEFLSIPESDLQAESERCADLRPMISPKTSGTWNVGDEILIGTWNAYDVSDCYWARLAENGDIRDNHFGDALRISVNVLSSDAQFEISSCAFYFANP